MALPGTAAECTVWVFSYFPKRRYFLHVHYATNPQDSLQCLPQAQSFGVWVGSGLAPGGTRACLLFPPFRRFPCHALEAGPALRGSGSDVHKSPGFIPFSAVLRTQDVGPLPCAAGSSACCAPFVAVSRALAQTEPSSRVSARQSVDPSPARVLTWSRACCCPRAALARVGCPATAVRGLSWQNFRGNVAAPTSRLLKLALLSRL